MANCRFMSSEDSSSGLFSKDIAYKPAESGWGAGKKYTSNYDNIFATKKGKGDNLESTQEIQNSKDNRGKEICG